jgi:hypothetical protein
VQVQTAHDARVQFKTDGRHVASRSARACSTLTFRAPVRARRALVKATVRDARELRAVRLR